MALDWTNDALARGLFCYRNRKFFEAHEHWESVWLASAEPDRTFLQSLIQVSAAFHHLERGNAIGAASLLRRSLTRLQRYPAEYGGINLDRLREQITQWLRALSGDNPLPVSCPHIL